MDHRVRFEFDDFDSKIGPQNSFLPVIRGSPLQFLLEGRSWICLIRRLCWSWIDFFLESLKACSSASGLCFSDWMKFLRIQKCFTEARVTHFFLPAYLAADSFSCSSEAILNPARVLTLRYPRSILLPSRNSSRIEGVRTFLIFFHGFKGRNLYMLIEMLFAERRGVFLSDQHKLKLRSRFYYRAIAVWNWSLRSLSALLLTGIKREIGYFSIASCEVDVVHVSVLILNTWMLLLGCILRLFKVLIGSHLEQVLHSGKSHRYLQLTEVSRFRFWFEIPRRPLRRLPRELFLSLRASSISFQLDDRIANSSWSLP